MDMMIPPAVYPKPIDKYVLRQVSVEAFSQHIYQYTERLPAME